MPEDYLLALNLSALSISSSQNPLRVPKPSSPFRKRATPTAQFKMTFMLLVSFFAQSGRIVHGFLTWSPGWPKGTREWQLLKPHSTLPSGRAARDWASWKRWATSWRWSRRTTLRQWRQQAGWQKNVFGQVWRLKKVRGDTIFAQISDWWLMDCDSHSGAPREGWKSLKEEAKLLSHFPNSLRWKHDVACTQIVIFFFNFFTLCVFKKNSNRWKETQRKGEATLPPQ